MIAVQSNVPHDKEQTLPLTNKDGTRGQVLIAHAVLTLLGESPPRIDRLDSRSANHLTSCAAPEFPMVPFRHQFRLLLSTTTAAFLPPPQIPLLAYLALLILPSLPPPVFQLTFTISPSTYPQSPNLPLPHLPAEYQGPSFPNPSPLPRYASTMGVRAANAEAVKCEGMTAQRKRMQLKRVSVLGTCAGGLGCELVIQFCWSIDEVRRMIGKGGG